jgi:peptidoglycan/xylan/chitin deacetylase (PgdA/CDA1 family)
VSRTVLLCADCEGTRAQIERITEVFARQEAPANYFFTGATASAEGDLVRRIAQTHHVGSHTFSHANLRRLTRAAQRDQIVRGRAAVEAVIGRAAEGFRAPFHAINRDTVDILNEEGFRYDASGLYFRYDMRRVIEIRPSWFRERMGLYDWLHLPPRAGWDILRVLFGLLDPLVVPVHPHYSGRDGAMAAALEDFLAFVKRRSGRFLTIPQYLEL